MSYVISLCCLTMILFSLFLDNKLYNPSVLFNSWWGLTIFISGIGLFGINVPSNTTYLYLLIGILSFNIPTLFVKTKSIKRKSRDEIKSEYHTFFSSKNIKIILILQFIVLLVLLFRSINVIGLINSGYSYSLIRYYYYRTDLIVASQYGMLLNNILITPVVLFGTIILSLSIFNKYRDKKIILSSVIVLLLYLFTSGGRGMVVYLGVSILATFFINKKEQNYKSINFIKLFAGIFTLILILVLISLIRSEGFTVITDLLETVVVYFTGSFAYFESLLPVIEQSPRLFGATFFGGIWDLFILFFNFLGTNIKQISGHIAEYNQIYLNIGNNIQFNAFTTMLYPFMYDFGKMGIIIQPLIFGIFSRYFYSRMEFNRSIKYKGIYLLIVIMIYESVLRWFGLFSYTWIVIFMFYMLVLINKKVIKIRR